MEPKVFISYSNEDRNIAKKITHSLREQDIQVSFEEFELQIEDSLIDKIKETLTSSDYILILISFNSINSQWFNYELNYETIKEFKIRDISIIPVLLEDCEIPIALRSFSIVDLSENFELGLKILNDKIHMIPEIDFSLLDHKSFEDLIFDLLKKLKFINIKRNHKILNIEVDFKAEYKYKDPFGEKITENWIVETKFYKNKRIDRRSVLQIISYLSIFPSNTTVALITTGHISSVTVDFLNNLENRVGDKIKIIDKTQLKMLLLDNEDLIHKFFK